MAITNISKFIKTPANIILATEDGLLLSIIYPLGLLLAVLVLALSESTAAIPFVFFATVV